MAYGSTVKGVTKSVMTRMRAAVAHIAGITGRGLCMTTLVHLAIGQYMDPAVKLPTGVAPTGKCA